MATQGFVLNHDHFRYQGVRATQARRTSEFRRLFQTSFWPRNKSVDFISWDCLYCFSKNFPRYSAYGLLPTSLKCAHGVKLGMRERWSWRSASFSARNDRNLYLSLVHEVAPHDSLWMVFHEAYQPINSHIGHWIGLAVTLFRHDFLVQITTVDRNIS